MGLSMEMPESIMATRTATIEWSNRMGSGLGFGVTELSLAGGRVYPNTGSV